MDEKTPENIAEAISIDDFKKVEIKIGEIRNAGKIEGSDKLLRLIVNFGDHDRQVLSGIAAYFPNPEELVGEAVPVCHQPGTAHDDGPREPGDDPCDRRRW